MTTLTFNYLRELQKMEKQSKELQKLEGDFYEQVKKYASRKARLAKSSNGYKERKEIENIRPVIKDIFNTRERKVVTGAIRSARSDVKMNNILPSEEKLFREVSECIKEFRINLSNVLAEKADDEENETKIEDAQESAEEEVCEANEGEPELMKISVVSDIPKFVGADMKSYGPWKEGDIAECPKNAAEIFIKSGRAEKAEK